ncbi:DUF2057 domain-containing protein [Halioglobus maricola]|nr:DUF2057 domain-containing protein [Halioglobus maricola]
MKFSRVTLPAALALASAQLMAGELHIPMAFEFLAVDGQKVKRSVVMRTSELELDSGQREIALRYSDMVDSDLHDAQDSVRSDAFIVSLDVEQGVDYYLKPAGGVIRKPLEFAEAPQVEIERKDGGAVSYTLTNTNIGQKEFETLLYSANQTGTYAAPSEPRPEAYSWAADSGGQIAAPAAVTSAAASAPESAAKPALASTPAAAVTVIEEDLSPRASAEGEPADMLKQWWQQADQKTRKEFLSWAVQQL